MAMNRRALLIGVIFLLSLTLFGCGSVYTDRNEYQDYIDKMPKADIYMPDLSTLPEYQSITVFYYERLGRSINLVITYSVESYESAKDTILSSYTYLDEPLMESDFYLIPEVEFQYQSFTIKVVSNDDFDYPEQFGMIGYSDSSYQITFLFFFDESLDRLSDSPERMTRFIESEFYFPEE